MATCSLPTYLDLFHPIQLLITSAFKICKVLAGPATFTKSPLITATIVGFSYPWNRDRANRAKGQILRTAAFPKPGNLLWISSTGKSRNSYNRCLLLGFQQENYVPRFPKWKPTEDFPTVSLRFPCWETQECWQ